MLCSRLTPSEMNELQRLLTKAKAAAGPPVTSPSAPSSLPMYDSTTGKIFDHMTPMGREVWDEGESWDDSEFEIAGAMSDAAKRREMDSDLGLQAVPKRINMTSGQPSYAADASLPPAPFAAEQLCQLPEVETKLPPFPEGVPDLTTWGCTIISFGMYDKKNMAYHELAFSQEERQVSYVKWVLARAGSAQGKLKDLCEYLQHVEAEKTLGGGLMIPGTTSRRMFKPLP